MKVYIERNNLQLELIWYLKNVDFIHVYVCKATDSMQYGRPNVYKEVSSTKHFGHCHFWTIIRDSNSLLAVVSQCMASFIIKGVLYIIML